MMRSQIGLVGLAAVVALVAGCTETTVGSDTIRSKAIWASFEVKSTGANSRLVARLKVGGDGDTIIYPLVPPDDLKVSVAGGAEESLSSTCPEENSYCSGNLGDIGGDKVKVNFDRGESSENAPNSTVAMPKPFEVKIPKDEVVRGNAVSLTLSGDVKGLRYDLDGDCIFAAHGEVQDGTIPADALSVLSSKKTQDCEVTVKFTRTATGDLDPNFGKGGRIVGIQERTATFYSLAEGSTPSPTTGSDAGTTTAPGSSSSSDAGVDSSSAVTDAGSSAPDAGPDSGATGGDASTTGQSTSDGGGQSSTGGQDAGSSAPDAAAADAGADAG